jgi:hypothetical protein
MPFFQNVFENDFIGHLLLEDRQYVLDFKVPANRNKSTAMVAWADAPYNTVGNTSLTFNYSIDAGKTFYAFSVSLTSGATRTAANIVSDLNGDTNFSNYFTASVKTDNLGNNPKPFIQTKTGLTFVNRETFKAYISNTSAETILRFNKYAGVAEMPTFFARHTIANYIVHGPNGDNAYPDSQCNLIQLSTVTDTFYITAAGFGSAPTAQADWQLLRGRSQAFMFNKNTVDASSRITQTIAYPAGAKAGDLAKLTTYTYTGAKTTPDQSAEQPYVLTSGDLITP